ncbi:MAG: hypothetical protein IPP72_17460 [Chitinophagaceae bacterium]|nr:hypothetical protein [Chitinophagaceae bacterium]
MYDVIASSFFQKRSCRLPGIGILELVTIPAEYDFLNRQINAPQQKIIFIPSSSADHSFNEFSAISQLLKEGLSRDGRVDITGLGAFAKDSSGPVQFIPADICPDFFQPVAAERVIHKDAEHSILVGDKETTNVEMTEYFTEDTATVKDRWWIWAIVLSAAAVAAIAYYIYQYGFNNLSSIAGFN